MAITMTHGGKATIEDLLQMPKDGMKYELVGGEILVSPAGMRHSMIAARITYLIARYLEGNPIGTVYSADVGIQFPNGNVRSPDVTFVRTAKLPGGQSPETFGELIPDLVVEVLSPQDRLTEIGRKIGEYLEYGVPLIWLVDPREKTVAVYRSLTDTERVVDGATITAEPVLPGFAVPVRSFFE
ncbi:MAG TPA: Uma2 family endonuclease [Terriglobia bacterium]|nr:Uma2 family endonuclease [Terriglobia bacterium]